MQLLHGEVVESSYAVVIDKLCSAMGVPYHIISYNAISLYSTIIL